MTRLQLIAAAMLSGFCLATAAAAQDDAAKDAANDAVSIELNAAKTNGDACTLSFLVVNGHGSQIDKVVYETVLLDAGGQVDRLTLFDFGTLPAGRPRVRQFSVQGVTCEGLGQVLINGAHTCEAPELPDGACESGLKLETRTTIEVIG